MLYDQLASPDLLALAPAGAERCYVGKRAGCHALEQDAMARWMVLRARRGLTVVRLQGGDPMLFGRGAEEIQVLEDAGIAWEVVPGVSAATGVAAAAGIALTARGRASGVRILSGHTPLPAASPPGSETLVLLMAAAQLAERTAELVAQGWDPATPAALIERGTLRRERRFFGPLGGIAAQAQRAQLQAPALLIAGAVAVPRKPARRQRMRHEVPPGLIVMAHGSPLPAWQQGVVQLAQELAAPGQFTHAAFLPPVVPSLADAVQAAREQRVRHLVVVPYFLAPGLHVLRDLPLLIAAEQRRDPRLRITLAAALQGHPALRTAVLARAEEALFAESLI